MEISFLLFSPLHWTFSISITFHNAIQLSTYFRRWNIVIYWKFLGSHTQNILVECILYFLSFRSISLCMIIPNACKNIYSYANLQYSYVHSFKIKILFDVMQFLKIKMQKLIFNEKISMNKFQTITLATTKRNC